MGQHTPRKKGCAVTREAPTKLGGVRVRGRVRVRVRVCAAPTLLVAEGVSKMGRAHTVHTQTRTAHCPITTDFLALTPSH